MLMQNAGTEAAMEWVLSHMEDPDFNEPLPASSSPQAPAQQQSSQKAADPEQVSMLGAMGFTPQQVVNHMLPHDCLEEAVGIP